jgi:hypothetical protein
VISVDVHDLTDTLRPAMRVKHERQTFPCLQDALHFAIAMAEKLKGQRHVSISKYGRWITVCWSRQDGHRLNGGVL